MRTINIYGKRELIKDIGFSSTKTLTEVYVLLREKPSEIFGTGSSSGDKETRGYQIMIGDDPNTWVCVEIDLYKGESIVKDRVDKNTVRIVIYKSPKNLWTLKMNKPKKSKMGKFTVWSFPLEKNK